MSSFRGNAAAPRVSDDCLMPRKRRWAHGRQGQLSRSPPPGTIWWIQSRICSRASAVRFVKRNPPIFARLVSPRQFASHLDKSRDASCQLFIFGTKPFVCGDSVPTIRKPEANRLSLLNGGCGLEAKAALRNIQNDPATVWIEVDIRGPCHGHAREMSVFLVCALIDVAPPASCRVILARVAAS